MGARIKKLFTSQVGSAKVGASRTHKWYRGITQLRVCKLPLSRVVPNVIVSAA